MCVIDGGSDPGVVIGAPGTVLNPGSGHAKPCCRSADGRISGSFTAEDVGIRGAELALQKVQGRTVALASSGALAVDALYCQEGRLRSGGRVYGTAPGATAQHQHVYDGVSQCLAAYDSV